MQYIQCLDDNHVLLPCAVAHYLTPVGLLQLNANRYGLSHITLAGSAHHKIASVTASNETMAQARAHITEAKLQLDAYFAGTLQQFTVPLAPKGTVFQRQVWQALLNIEYGQSCSYGEIAHGIERPKAVRAVGAANGANPLAIIVPCHRVIGKNGTLTGYAYGLAMKQHLLTLESQARAADLR